MPSGCTVEESRAPDSWADALRAPQHFIRDRRAEAQSGAPIELRYDDLRSPDAVQSVARRVLEARGFSALEQELFLAPPDPRDRGAGLAGIEQLRDLIITCRRSGEGVAIQVDYDVDGLSTGAILETVLSRFGIKNKVYVSDRHRQGYDVQQEILKQASGDGFTRLVIGDLGSHRGDLLSAAVRDGLFRSYTVLDHHLSDERDIAPHTVPIVNPNQPGDTSGLGHLCASGISMVAGMKALEEIPGLSIIQREETISRIVSLAALGTVADLVPLTTENRWITRTGLELLKIGTLPGIEALASVFNQKLPLLNEEGIAFFLGPAINSASRVSWRNATLFLEGALHGAPPARGTDAERYREVMEYARSGKNDRLMPGLEALETEMAAIEQSTPSGTPFNLTRIVQKLLRADSVAAAESAAKALHALNILRQGIEFHGYETAKRVLHESPPLSSSPVVVAFSPLFDIGVAGLVASRLARELSRPVAIVTMLDSEGIVDSGGRRIYAASVRSGPTTLHVGKSLAECTEFFSRGGHQAAGGFKCYAENFPAGVAQWEKAALRDGYDRNPAERTDLSIPLSKISADLIELRSALAPTGQAAPALRVEARSAWVYDITTWRKEHTRVELRSGSKSLTAYLYRSRLPSAIRKGECVNVVLSVHQQGAAPLYIIEDATPTPISDRRADESPLYAQPQLGEMPFDPKVRRRFSRVPKERDPEHSTPRPEQITLDLDLRQPKPQAKNAFGEVLQVPNSMPSLVKELGITCLRVEHLDYVLRFRDAQVRAALAFTETNGNVLWCDPTGAGKTVKAIIVMATELSRASHQRILVTFPTDAIREQWRKEIEKYLDLPEGAVLNLTSAVKRADREPLIADVKHRIILSTPELINQLAEQPEFDLGAYVQLAIIDERHIAQGNHSLARLERVLRRGKIRTLSLTATPGRSPERLREQLFVAGAELNPSEAKRRHVNEEMLSVTVSGAHKEALDKIRGNGERLTTEVLFQAREFPRLFQRVRSGAFVSDATGLFHFPGITERNSMSELVRPLTAAHAKLKQAFYSFYRAAHMYETLAWSGVLPYLDYGARLIMNNQFPKDLALREAYLVLSKGTAFDRLTKYWDPAQKLKNIPQAERQRLVREALRETGTSSGFVNHPKDDMIIDLAKRHLECDPGLQIIIPVREVAVARHLAHRMGEFEKLSSDFVIGKRGSSRKNQLAAVDRFKRGEYAVMLGTSAVELGLDVANAQIVIHHSVALTPEADEQRNGRAGRRERSGIAYRLVTEGTGEEETLLRLLHRRKLMRSATKPPPYIEAQGATRLSPSLIEEEDAPYTPPA